MFNCGLSPLSAELRCEVLFYNLSADSCADKSSGNYDDYKRDRPPRPENFGRGKYVILAAVGNHLVCHCLSRNAVGNNRAAESGKNLIDDIADSQRFSVAVADFSQQQFCNNAR